MPDQMCNNQGNICPKQGYLDVQSSFVICTIVICVQMEPDINLNILPSNGTGWMTSSKLGSRYEFVFQTYTSQRSASEVRNVRSSRWVVWRAVRLQWICIFQSVFASRIWLSPTGEVLASKWIRLEPRIRLARTLPTLHAIERKPTPASNRCSVGKNTIPQITGTHMSGGFN